MLYMVTPYPNNVIAIDLASPGKPAWKYPAARPAAARRGWRAATSSTAAPRTAAGRIYFNTLDNRTIALDAQTGREVWQRRWATSTRASR